VSQGLDSPFAIISPQNSIHHSDHMMTLILPLTNNTHVTLISVYAATMTHSHEDKDLFYASLRLVIHSIPTSVKLLLL
jgi:hypothetical protein